VECGAGDGTDANQRPGVIRNSIQGITAFFLSEKELLNNPPPLRALDAAVVSTPAVRSPLYIVPGVYCLLGSGSFSSLVAAIAMVEEKTRQQFAGLLPRGSAHRSCLLGKFPWPTCWWG